MSANHVLFFISNGPRDGKAGQMMENRKATQAYWNKKKAAGEIESVEHVILASSGNPNMPAGFTLVTGDRAKLHKIRWDDAEFLNLHTIAMTTTNGYACIDGYAGEELEKHMQRLASTTRAQ
jgi:hypothetical protein